MIVDFIDPTRYIKIEWKCELPILSPIQRKMATNMA